jgi:outer membrane protein assembly factor BamA
VLAGHAWLVGTQVADGHAVPLYLSPSLGGANTLRGYTDYRFHDRALLLLSAEARVPLMRHLDLAGFVDAGNVAPRVGDLDVARRSYGTGLRLHTDRTTLVRLDLAHGEEGWRVVFRTTDALKLARVTRRSATVPFAP